MSDASNLQDTYLYKLSEKEVILIILYILI